MSAASAAVAVRPTTAAHDAVPLKTWIAVIGAAMGAFLAILNIQIVSSSLADIQGGIGAGSDEGGWITTAYLVAEIIVIPISGWLARVFSVRTYLLVNTALFLVLSIVCAFATNLSEMIVARAAQGFAGGVLIPLAFTIIMTKLTAAGGLALTPRLAVAQNPASGSTGDAAPKRGGTMTIMFFQEPPMLVSLVNTNSLTCSAKVTEGLLWYDHDLNPHPQLATAWTIAPDGLTYTFTLRQQVKWHDGQPFTSADVAASLAILKTMHPRGRSTYAHLKEVQTPDDHTVVLKLDAPVPYLIKAFARRRIADYSEAHLRRHRSVHQPQ